MYACASGYTFLWFCHTEYINMAAPLYHWVYYITHDLVAKYQKLAITSKHTVESIKTLTKVFYPRYHWVTGLGFYGNQSATQAIKVRIQLLCSQDKQYEAK